MASAARLRAPSARIFAPMIEPPKMVWRDFVLMFYHSSTRRREQATSNCVVERMSDPTGLVNV
jgi:hypothetical protein